MATPQAREPAAFVLGVDGGKTKTLTALASADGRLLAATATGPCNHIHEPGGLERQYRALRAGYEAVFEAVGQPPGRLESVYVGLSGSGDRATVERVYDTARLTLDSDLPIALSGAIPSMRGVIVLAGTGSAAYGRSAAGDVGQAGGQGYYAGDEGGGYDIAQQGFRAAYQAADGRGPQTALTGLLLAHYGSDTLRALRDRIYGQLTRDQLAAAAGLVARAANDGDAVARRILEQAGGELARCAIAVLDQLQWPDDVAPVAPVGSVFRAGSFITGPMLARIHKAYPRAVLQPPRFPAVIGAVLLALRAAGMPVTEQVLDSLGATRARVDV